MRIRACLFGLMAAVSLTSGCACCDHPCWGWRFHPCHSPCCSTPAPCCGGCPAFSSPVSAPVVYRPPTVAVSPDCPCASSTPVLSHPVPLGNPSPYPPIISNPMPLPGTTITPGTSIKN